MENNPDICFICREAIPTNTGIWWYPIAKQEGWENPGDYASHKQCFDKYFTDAETVS